MSYEEKVPMEVALAAYARGAGVGPETALQIGRQVYKNPSLSSAKGFLAEVERLVGEHKRSLGGTGYPA